MANYNKGKKKKDFTPINDQIRVDEVRVILEEGGTMGVMTTRDAITEAQGQGLDLVLVSPNAKPPVAKIIDYGKYKYQKEKKDKDNKKASKTKGMKQIRFGLKIGENDLDIKLKKVVQFLDEGHKVRVSAFFRGREMAHPEIGRQLLNRAIEKLGDLAIVEQEPAMAGRLLSVTIRGNAKALKEHSETGDALPKLDEEGE